MTIIAGFVANNGILLCADTEYTSTTKTYSTKLFSQEFAFGTVAFALAGNAEFASAAVKKIFRYLDSLKPQKVTSHPLVADAIEQALSREYTRHILKRPDHTDPKYWYQFLIAIRLGADGTLGLYTTYETSVQQSDRGFECKGAGDELGTYLMAPLYAGPHVTLAEAFVAATYGLARVKETVPYCGGPTETIILHADFGKVPPVQRFDIDLMEKYSKRYDQEARWLLSKLGNFTISEEEFPLLVNLFARNVTDLRHEWENDKEVEEAIRQALARATQGDQ